MQRFRFFFCFAGVLFVFSAALGANPSWTESALKLSADPIERAKGIEELKSFADLNMQLGNNLWNEKSELTLAVILALELHEFYPKIYKKIQNTKSNELHWKWIQIATSLVRTEDREALATLYHSKLGVSDLSAPVMVALLDSLETLQKEVDEKKLALYLNHSSYEVREEAVRIAGRLAKSKPQYGLVIKEALIARPYQVRLLAYESLSETPALIENYKAEIAASCKNEAHEKVKAICSQAARK